MIDQKYLSGNTLYGDDFDCEAIEKWFREEEYGYYNLVDGPIVPQVYGYHGLNWEHLFRHIEARQFETCLGIGCADGAEIAPIADRIKNLIALETAEGWWSESVSGVPTRYTKPRVDGLIDLPDSFVDLITCLGVLHHIPNVSTVLKELGRVSRPGAYFLLREPNNSMGDWTVGRRGLTKNERGIPRNWLLKAAKDSGFILKCKSDCMFPTTAKISNLLGIKDYFNPRSIVMLDKLLCAMTSWNVRYSRNRLYNKIAATSTAYVFVKGPSRI